MKISKQSFITGLEFGIVLTECARNTGIEITKELVIHAEKKLIQLINGNTTENMNLAMTAIIMDILKPTN